VPPSAEALKTRAESQPSAHVLHGADLNAAADELSACPLDAATTTVQALDRAGCYLIKGLRYAYRPACGQVETLA
jgi:hypothetical protein